MVDNKLFLTDLTAIVLLCIVLVLHFISFYFYFVLTAFCKALLSTG